MKTLYTPYTHTCYFEVLGPVKIHFYQISIGIGWFEKTLKYLLHDTIEREKKDLPYTAET